MPDHSTNHWISQATKEAEPKFGHFPQQQNCHPKRNHFDQHHPSNKIPNKKKKNHQQNHKSPTQQKPNNTSSTANPLQTTLSVPKTGRFPFRRVPPIGPSWTGKWALFPFGGSAGWSWNPRRPTAHGRGGDLTGCLAVKWRKPVSGITGGWVYF